MSNDNYHNITSAQDDQLRDAKLLFKEEINNAIHNGDLEKFTALVKQHGDFLNESQIILTLVKNDSYIEFLNVCLEQSNIDLNIQDEYDRNPLSRAIYYNSNIIASKIIAQYGNDQNVINPKNSICPPLHVAAYRGNMEMIIKLLECGADPILKNTLYNHSPSEWVVIKEYHTHQEIKAINEIRTLLEKPSGHASLKAAQDIPTASESDSTEDHFSFSDTVRSWGKTFIGWVKKVFTLHHPEQLIGEHHDTQYVLGGQEDDLNGENEC